MVLHLGNSPASASYELDGLQDSVMRVELPRGAKVGISGPEATHLCH